jgi:hypothetical protein
MVIEIFALKRWSIKWQKRSRMLEVIDDILTVRIDAII